MGETEAPVGSDQKQIGEVADRTGLSLRTIRYYEEVGLVTPSSRSQGGFRLYSEPDIARLELVKRMKPLDFSLEEMRDLLVLLDSLEKGGSSATEDEALLDRLAMYRLAAEERCTSLRAQLTSAEQFADSLRRETRRRRKVMDPSR
ncbi:MerR family transcriptional regulator [Actinotalea sp. K2]|uniref:MerR family transcriptional regulator n=1 Tax=Actinotalea sp. K2 TaxID=2939438 RepID=UPI002017D075|nr:MerR family transcriptional regulator [Actinotalea sp. K2]MCL3861846.1 MerR family transcriptional regulator [Actinotalea sp. K2]